MNTNSGGVLFKDEVYELVGSSIEVLNGIGHGLHEKPYENALVVEFRIRGIPCDQQRAFDVMYKGVSVGVFRPDLLAYGSIVVDAKVIDRITDIERDKC